MFAFSRYFRRKRGSPSGQPARLPCKLFLEALEDRLVLSTAAVPPLLSHFAPVPFTAIAGQTFSPVVASFDSASVAGLSASIIWGDGHTGGGNILSSGNQAFQISGTNSYAQTGLYTVVVSIAAAGNSVQVQETILVVSANLSQPSVFALPTGLTVAVSPIVINDSTTAFFVNIVPSVTSNYIEVVVVAAPAGTSPAPVGQPIILPYPIPVTAPVPVSYSDQIPFAGMRELGLTVAIVPVSSAALHSYGAINNLATTNDPSRTINIVAPSWAGTVTVQIVTILLNTGNPIAAHQEPTIPHGQSSDSATSAQAELANSQIPAYRVADRSELRGSIGLAPPAPFVFGDVPTPLEPINRFDITLKPNEDSSSQPKSVLRGGHSVNLIAMLEISATLIVGHVLHVSLSSGHRPSVLEVAVKTAPPTASE